MRKDGGGFALRTNRRLLALTTVRMARIIKFRTETTKGIPMAEQFQTGDTVKLKSGGPQMTVTDTRGASGGEGALVWCAWFDEKNMPQREHFPPAALEKF